MPIWVSCFLLLPFALGAIFRGNWNLILINYNGAIFVWRFVTRTKGIARTNQMRARLTITNTLLNWFIQNELRKVFWAPIIIEGMEMRNNNHHHYRVLAWFAEPLLWHWLCKPKSLNCQHKERILSIAGYSFFKCHSISFHSENACFHCCFTGEMQISLAFRTHSAFRIQTVRIKQIRLKNQRTSWKSARRNRISASAPQSTFFQPKLKFIIREEAANKINHHFVKWTL